MTALVWQRAAAGAPVLLLAHGAGAPMDSAFMQQLSTSLCEAGVSVARFEFPYMAQRRQGGSKRPPDRAPVLLECFAEAVELAGGLDNIFIGGKSLGGRMASLLAAEHACRGVICFGYPFHPPGKPDRLRTEHLATLSTPMLICQGERDPFGRREEVEGYRLSSAIRIHWCADGNHDLAPRKTSGVTAAQNLAAAVAEVAAWMTAR